MFDISLYLSNPIIWLMLILSLFSYQLLLDLCFSSRDNSEWQQRVYNWLPSLRVLLSSLPLLGLLGTVVGLLHTFGQMSYGSVDQQSMLSGGIADALLTTEVGLLMVVPGWVLLALLERRLTRHEVDSCVLD